MTLESPSRQGAKRVRWWRQGWVWLAVAILGAEVGTVRLLSARGNVLRPPSRSPVPRYRVVPELEGSAEAAHQEAWSSLMNPAVMLMPSADDFSGSSWLAGPVAEVALEAFLARIQPLPFEPIRGGGGGLDAYPRVDPGPGSRWEVTGGMGPLPKVASVPLPDACRVRILEGLSGWQLMQDIRLEPMPGGLLAQRAVVRVMIDGSGEPASPPVIWESSGAAAADDAALKLVRGLQLTRNPVPVGPAPVDARSWGFIGVTWPAAREDAVKEAGKRP